MSRTNDNVDVGSSFEDQFLIFLSHTSHHADDLFGVIFFGLAKSPERTVGLVFGLFAYRAGVEQDCVGVADIVGQFVSLPTEIGNDHFAVQHIHLAANGFDVQFVGSRWVCPRG